MDDLREVAKAYHGRATNEEKEKTKNYFRSLDSNGDGKISRADIKSDPALQRFTHDSLFDCLDENNNGTLDFQEFLTLDYMRKCGMRWCKSCSDWLIGSTT
ncbi:hypothetical protein MIMGU_mgv1a025498mg [Erythranthe guttata]|uniref:EF-hand domain-containing protein n=1 Tax=Erythranthe guttata TaxID=4155 RepID=A0A022REX6_ERYGU|nr:PREDICTED: calcineurin subunit B-like [Erythranthe guttata]EYU38323.1 hypothetical protein MIMGU_mgv1a025498mg [Erythranthe guttata]|eukprot:XP_012836312.1 PREDICTED: calcineurin subunit B-like [Erythranthe guttata]